MKIKNHLESYLRVSRKKEVHRNTIEQQTHTTFVLSNYMHLIAIYHSPIWMSRSFLTMSKLHLNNETHLSKIISTDIYIHDEFMLIIDYIV